MIISNSKKIKIMDRKTNEYLFLHHLQGTTWLKNLQLGSKLNSSHLGSEVISTKRNIYSQTLIYVNVINSILFQGRILIVKSETNTENLIEKHEPTTVPPEFYTSHFIHQIIHSVLNNSDFLLIDSVFQKFFQKNDLAATIYINLKKCENASNASFFT